METLTANSPDDLSARVLADLKMQLERLTSFSAELGVLRESAASTVQAAGSVLGLVDELGELQRSQISELRAVSDTTLALHRDELAKLADDWGQKWLQEATKSLSVLDEIVSRQHTLATEITEFHEAMRNAGSFVEAQLSMHKQVLSLGDEMRQDSAARTTSLELLMTLVKQNGGALRTEMQRTATEQNEAVAGLTSAVRESADASENASKLLHTQQSELAVTLKESDRRLNQEMQLLAQKTKESLEAQESLGERLAELSKVQAKQHEYVCNALLNGQSGSRRWQVATMAVLIMIIVLLELLR